MSKLISFEKSTMSKRPSYNELVYDTILNPQDKIQMPDRQAKILRNSQKLTQFDDPASFDLEQQSKHMFIN
jgi:hypothetical protein